MFYTKSINYNYNVQPPTPYWTLLNLLETDNM